MGTRADSARSPRGRRTRVGADRARRSGLLAVAQLSLPVLGLWLPLVGLVASLGLALRLVPAAGRRLWEPGRSALWGVALLGFAAMWLPAVLALTGLARRLVEEESAFPLGSTAWLLLPLCAPEQQLPPALVATAVFTVGAVVSAVVRRPWPWVLGALLSPLSYDAALSVLATDVSC